MTTTTSTPAPTASAFRSAGNNVTSDTNPTFDGLVPHPERLQQWFDANVPGTAAPLFLTQLRGGASNALFRVERGGEIYALRRPPKIRNDKTSNDILREFTVLRALAKTDVPHPRLVATCEDPQVMDMPFEVLQWIDGFTPFKPFPEPFHTDPAMRRELGFAIIDGLAQVANVDWRAVGLEGYGKPEGFLERQADRWLGQLDRYRSRELEYVNEIAAWLRANTPVTPRIGLIHGDYSPANVMVGHGKPARLAAIVDWESATIGDPLLDLGHLLSSWQDDDSGPTWGLHHDWRDFPSRREAAERYAEKTGLPIDKLPYYMTLATFKLALILEGAYYRYATGRSQLAEHAAMEKLVPQMLRQAATMAGIA